KLVGLGAHLGRQLGQSEDSTDSRVEPKLQSYPQIHLQKVEKMLAVAPDCSATSNILKRYKLGLVSDPGDSEGLKEGIIAAVECRAPVPSRDTVERFSAMGVTKKLMEIVLSLE
ncbi:MAG: hypothetical protein KAX38_03195, partial [Candidatus Krumholzibacteria bacterium]|nr:hypothetical protein [Candidatus Krumholzibacteria bacterium]